MSTHTKMKLDADRAEAVEKKLSLRCWDWDEHNL